VFGGIGGGYHAMLTQSPRKVLVAVDSSFQMKSAWSRVLELLDSLDNQRYTTYSLVTEKNPIHSWRSTLELGNVVPYAPADFSKLTGFSKVIKNSVRYYSYTPKPEYTNWNKSFKNGYERIDQFTPQTEYRNRPVTALNWGEDQWKLFCTFTFMRKKIKPLLQKIDVRYESYATWMKTLEDHCTVHTGIYPDGYQNYACYCFLVDTDYEESVKALFSLFPTTSFITELEKQLLCFAYVTSSDVKRKLICLLYDMETKNIMNRFNQAVVLFHSQYTPGS